LHNKLFEPSNDIGSDFFFEYDEEAHLATQSNFNSLPRSFSHHEVDEIQIPEVPPPLTPYNPPSQSRLSQSEMDQKVEGLEMKNFVTREREKWIIIKR